MAEKRHLLRRTAAFITALVFMGRVAPAGVIIAEEIASSEMPVTSVVNTETESAGTDAPVSAVQTDIFTQAGSVSQDTQADTAGSLPDETVYSVQKTTGNAPVPETVEAGSVIITSASLSETEAQITGPANRRNIKIRIKINGSSAYRPSLILEKLFYQVKLLNFTTTIMNVQDTAVIEAEVLGEVDMEDQLWEKEKYKSGDQVMFDAGLLHYELEKLDSHGNICDIELKEYYDVSGISGENAKITPYNDADNGKQLLPHGTKMKFEAVNGFKLNGSVPFILEGNTTSGVYAVGGRYYLIVKSGENETSAEVSKTVYQISTPAVAGLKADINGTGAGSFTGRWKDGGEITIHYQAEEFYNSKIFAASIVDTATGKKFPMTVTGDGKDVTAKLKVSGLGNEYTDGKKFSVEIKVIPDAVKINALVSDGGSEKPYRECEFETAVSDDQKTMLIDPILYVNGVAAYIIDSYEANGKTEAVDAKDIFDNNRFYEPVMAPYDSNGCVHYKKIVIDSDKNYGVSSNCIKQGNKNVYSIMNAFYMALMDIKAQDGINFTVLYTRIQNDKEPYQDTFSNNSSCRFNLLNDFDQELNAVHITSILYYDNNEFHNMLTDPIYYYVDKHAPELSMADEMGKEFSGELWAKDEYEFVIRTDDAEYFKEDPAAGEEVNEVYRNISGSSSPVTEIRVGGSVLKKKDGKWTETKGAEDQPYSVSVVQTDENRFRVRVRLDSDDRSVEKELPVSVADSCGNRSAEKSLKIRYERVAPEVTSLKLENAVVYDHPVTGKTAGVGLAARGTHPDKAYLEVEVKEDGSGPETVVLESKTVLGGIKIFSVKSLMDAPESRFEKKDGVYRFRIPVPASANASTDISVSVEDFAGNSGTYVYNGGDAPLAENEKGAVVVFDATAPSADLSVSGTPDYTDPKQRKWYAEIPEFTVKAGDEKAEVESGLRFLDLDVNGKTFRTEDLSGRDISEFVIEGEMNGNVTDIYLKAFSSDSSERVKIASADLAVTDGELRVTAKAVDGAGNESEAVSSAVYIDADTPQSDKVFYLESENDNYRSFGTFLNHSASVTVDVKEPEGRPSSGLKSAELFFGGKTYRYTFASEKSSKAVFMIPFDNSVPNAFSGSASVRVTDNAGNTFTSEKLLSPSGSSDIVFENIPPAAGEITPAVKAKYTVYTGGEKTEWFDSDTAFTMTVDDSADGKSYSGLKKTEISINGKYVVTDDLRNEKKVTPEKEYRFSTADINDEKSESYIIAVHTEDNAGNRADTTKTVSVDRTVPVIKDIEIDGAGSVPSVLSKGVLVAPFGYFFRDSVKLNVYAVDENVSSGLGSIELDFYDPYGTRLERVSVSGQNLKLENGVYSAEFTVPEGFRGYITAGAEDNVGHESELYRPEGFITENEERHSATSSLSITLPDTEHRDRNGLSLYSSDINAVINAEDSFSGIRSFEWHTDEYGADKWKSINVQKDGEITGDELNDMNVTKKESNLVLAFDGRTQLSQDKNSGKFRVKMTDNTGHGSETEKDFSIDKKAPVVSVSFENTESDADSGIYSASRTAVVSVNERNFDPERISVTADGNESGVSFGNWSLASGAEGTDSAVYRMPVTFSGDGSYTLKAEGTDMCDNKSETYTSENFVIDRTAPVMEVSSSGAELVNGKYYAGARNLTVTITEHNFDVSRIKINGTKNGSAAGFPEAKFSTSGDVHTAVLEFADDGDYTVSIEGMDAAGNPFEGYSDSFTVDASAPEISFEGAADKSANRDEVTLDAFIHDANISEKNITVSLIGSKRGDLSATAGVLAPDEEGYHFTFTDFPEEQSIDDIYTASVTATDAAGNVSEKTITFSVNRFGSNYYFDKASLAAAGKYIKEPIDIILHEINVDPLDMEKTMVNVMRDGNVKTLEKDRDYTLEVTGGDGSWCEYCYDIKASNFHDDAAYHVVVMTEDAAGNQNANFMDGKKAEFKFGVDGTPPKCIPINIENGCAMRADRVKVDLVCEDNILLDNLDVFVNDVHAEEKYERGSTKYSFTLLSSDEPQTVKINLTDVAGNETNMVIDNILISTSYLKVALRSPWLKAAAGLLAIGGGACGVMKYRKKKERKARYGG
ncbi:Ig-like domain-containing protein [Ruminococcus sp. HUN007]|uniref:Ig-like domain-containing protein n=1 Tax=Ruminococcus sp. HUN007 TaxID=1514668 RepID=UPI000B1CB244|nr:Ig-like domain-containing protein [Ruminococcus sp. HUN007]